MDVKQKLMQLSPSGVLRLSDVIDDDDDAAHDLVITRVFQGKSEYDPHSENKYTSQPKFGRRASMYTESAGLFGQASKSATNQSKTTGGLWNAKKNSGLLRQMLGLSDSVSGGDTCAEPESKAAGKAKVKFSVSEVGEALEIEDLEEV